MQQPPQHGHHYGHQDVEDNQAIDDINNLELDFDQLNMLGPLALDSDHHNHGHIQGSGAHGAHNSHGNTVDHDGAAANLYEEDFDGMLDDLNQELPPHACR